MRIAAKEIAKTYGPPCDQFVKQKPKNMRPHLALWVGLYVVGRNMHEAPFDPKITPRLMVGVSTVSLPRNFEVTGGIYIANNGSYYTKRGNARLTFNSKTAYYRLKPDGTFYYRRNNNLFENLYFNYPEIRKTITEFLSNL